MLWSLMLAPRLGDAMPVQVRCASLFQAAEATHAAVWQVGRLAPLTLALMLKHCRHLSDPVPVLVSARVFRPVLSL